MAGFKQLNKDGVDSKWFGAAEAVTGIQGVGGTQAWNLGIIKDNTELFLEVGNKCLFKKNIGLAKELLMNGKLSGSFIDANEVSQSFHGLSGIELDLKMVEYKQSNLQYFIEKYSGPGDMESIRTNIKSLMNLRVAPRDVRKVMDEHFNGGDSFYFANYEHRVKLGQELIKLLHKNNDE